MNRQKIHDTKLHATSQMAFRPILLSRVKFGAYKGNKIYISIMLRIIEEKKNCFLIVTLFIFLNLWDTLKHVNFQQHLLEILLYYN